MPGTIRSLYCWWSQNREGRDDAVRMRCQSALECLDALMGGQRVLGRSLGAGPARWTVISSSCFPTALTACTRAASDGRRFPAAEGGCTELVRVAVTAAQVEEYGLPTALPKATDRRSFSAPATTQAEALPEAVGLRVRFAL